MLSDGGDGFVECIHQIIPKSKVLFQKVNGPYLEPTMTKYMLIGDKAVIEVASSCGMETTDWREVMDATSLGLGELIKNLYVEERIAKFLIGVGGSAFSDLGMGCLKALGLDIETITPNAMIKHFSK